jgi:flagellar basal-body rod modification protein FlgD
MSTVDSAVNSTATSTPTSAESSKKKTGSTSLGKDDFLKLLITQMGHQDPLNPTDQTQQLAQLAQFSALEQMQNMNVSTRTSQAVNMINSIINWSDDDGYSHQGVVTGVTIKDGEPQLTAGEDYTTADLTKVVDKTISMTVPVTDKDGKSTTTTVTGVIKEVKGTTEKPLFVVSIPVTQADGKVKYEEGTMDPSDTTKYKGVMISPMTVELNKVTSIVK